MRNHKGVQIRLAVTQLDSHLKMSTKATVYRIMYGANRTIRKEGNTPGFFPVRHNSHVHWGSSIHWREMDRLESLFRK